jgi:hypothetical protein
MITDLGGTSVNLPSLERLLEFGLVISMEDRMAIYIPDKKINKNRENKRKREFRELTNVFLYYRRKYQSSFLQKYIKEQEQELNIGYVSASDTALGTHSVCEYGWFCILNSLVINHYITLESINRYLL